MKVYPRHRELGLAGLALLRNWLVGDEETTKVIVKDIRKIFESPNDIMSATDNISAYDISSGYQLWAETYDSIPNILIKVEEPAIKSLFKKLPVGDALDVGCGTGRYSRILHSLGHLVTGVDQSPAMLQKARSWGQQINYIQGNLNSLPLKDKSFDLVTCALAITHFPNISEVLSELKRVVRPGGHILISDIHPWLVALGAQADFRDKEERWGYVRNYIHWHSTYINEFHNLDLKLVQCVEPVIGLKHVNLAHRGFDLSAKTIAAALQGLPIALIWVLEKS